MNFVQALELLERRQETRWKLGLGRAESLLKTLGNPQNDVPVVHVAGTNGKGSFCAMLSSVLEASGRRVGLFTSPHLIGPRERIRIDGKSISEEDFAQAITAVQDAETEDASYFEMVTAAAFLHFRRVGADIAVVEVGMGGRLDATNTISRPLLSVITSIDIDHAKHLGATPTDIAKEKAGIIKPDVPCLIGPDNREAQNVIRGRAEALNSKWSLPGPSPRAAEVFWQEGAQDIEAGGVRYRLGLLGAPAVKNAGLVLTAVDLLRKQNIGIPQEAVEKGLSRVRWPGRFEVQAAAGGRTLVLDGAHNPAAMEAFVKTWRACPWSEDAMIIFGVLKDKDYVAMIQRLAPYASRVVATSPRSPRSLSAAQAVMHFRAAGCVGVQSAPDAGRAIKAWHDSKIPHCAVVGSFYLVGEVLERVSETPV